MLFTGVIFNTYRLLISSVHSERCLHKVMSENNNIILFDFSAVLTATIFTYSYLKGD